MIIPELPAFLESLGGKQYLGLIISLFTLTAGLSRPFSGKLSDTVGRIPVMVFGALICFLAGFLYVFVTSVSAFLLLRLFHGMSTGFKPTGTSAMVADVVPAEKRGEALGILGVFLSLGMALGPAIGGWIAHQYSTDVMFYTSSILGILSVVILVGMKETLPNPQKFTVKALRISKEDVFEPRVFKPALVMMLTSFSFGTILTIIPDFSEHLGILNKGLFFTYFTLASLGIRILAGKLSDKMGRVFVLRLSTIILGISMGLIGWSESSFFFLGSAIILGVAVGMNSPTLFAWAIDLSDPALRGRAMSTIFIALEIGIGLGAIVSAWLYDDQPVNFTITFWTPGVIALMAFAYLIFQKNQHKVESDIRPS